MSSPSRSPVHISSHLHTQYLDRGRSLGGIPPHGCALKGLRKEVDAAKGEKRMSQVPAPEEAELSPTPLSAAASALSAKSTAASTAAAESPKEQERSHGKRAAAASSPVPPV